MRGAQKGNKNALKHGLYAGTRIRAAAAIVEVVHDELRKPAFAVQYLESTIDEIYRRMMEARGQEFTRLANSLALATTALFNGHRTLSYLSGGATPMEEALRELRTLEFNED